MVTVTDVYNALKNYSDTEGVSESKLTSFAEAGLNFVKGRLRDDSDENSPLILRTATVVAHYNFFLRTISSTDRYESYKAGDMTVRRNISKEFQIEKEVLINALCEAADILTDKGFCFIVS